MQTFQFRHVEQIVTDIKAIKLCVRPKRVNLHMHVKMIYSYVRYCIKNFCQLFLL